MTNGVPKSWVRLYVEVFRSGKAVFVGSKDWVSIHFLERQSKENRIDTQRGNL